MIWKEQRTRYHESNTVERCSYRGGGIIVWEGISLHCHTVLQVFHKETLTSARNRYELFDPYFRQYARTIGDNFILKDDNAQPHQTAIVEDYLESHGLERKEWPVLNPIEHLWDYLGRQFAPHPKSLHEPEHGLLRVCPSLSISLSYNLIDRMKDKFGVDTFLIEPFFIILL